MTRRSARNGAKGAIDSVDRLLRTIARASAAARLANGSLAVSIHAGGIERRIRIGQEVLVEALSLGLVSSTSDGVMLTPEGRARLARASNPDAPFLGQHRPLRRGVVSGSEVNVIVDAAESPLAWLRRRRGKTGRGFISDHGFDAGERLRADFTTGNMMPRVTANWDMAVASGRHSPRQPSHSEVVLGAQDRVRSALRGVGPELSGMLVDVCCFLKGLEDVERDRGWPPRSAKVVLSIALERLAAHYGMSGEAAGPLGSGLRSWGTPDHRPRGRVGSPGEPEEGAGLEHSSSDENAILRK
jgi:hypothetical protein